jgi:type I site-specific restriction endonuclease
MNTNQNQSPFGEVIYSYTRAQAVADGVQVDVSKVAAEAGIRFPVFLTRTVFDAFAG